MTPPPDAHAHVGRGDGRNPFEYARDLFDRCTEASLERFERMRSYVDEQVKELRTWAEERNRHRMEAIETVGEHAAQALADLHQGDARPGWVKMTFDAHGQRLVTLEDALGEEGWVRKAFADAAETMKWQNRLLIGALIGLCANLGVALLK